MKMWLALAGSIAIEPIERSVATGQVPTPDAHGAVFAVLPETTDHDVPPLVDL
jgi:hypothetical protein